MADNGDGSQYPDILRTSKVKGPLRSISSTGNEAHFPAGVVRRFDDDGGGENVIARFANIASVVVFIAVLFIFNIAFWVTALAEQNMAADEVLRMKKPIK